MTAQSHQKIFRHVEENTCRSSIYGEYNSILRYWLRDKPQKLVKHCVERLTSAGSNKDERVTPDEFWENILSGKFKYGWYLDRLSCKWEQPSLMYIHWLVKITPSMQACAICCYWRSSGGIMEIFILRAQIFFLLSTWQRGDIFPKWTRKRMRCWI